MPDDSTFPPSGVDRSLLFGVLALQLDFVGRADLQRALLDWGGDRSRPLSEVLVHSGALAPRRKALLDELVREYLARHDMNAARGLTAASAARPAIDLAAPPHRRAPALVLDARVLLRQLGDALAGPALDERLAEVL